MSMTFDDLLKKVASDPDFRVALVHDPKKTLEDAGATPTDEQIAAIKGLDLKSIETVAKAFGGQGVHADTIMFC